MVKRLEGEAGVDEVERWGVKDVGEEEGVACVGIQGGNVANYKGESGSHEECLLCNVYETTYGGIFFFAV